MSRWRPARGPRLGWGSLSNTGHCEKLHLNSIGCYVWSLCSRTCCVPQGSTAHLSLHGPEPAPPVLTPVWLQGHCLGLGHGNAMPVYQVRFGRVPIAGGLIN